MKRSFATVLMLILAFMGQIESNQKNSSNRELNHMGEAFPKETVFLKFPNGGEKNWREFHRKFPDGDEGIVAWLPLNQKPDNWSEIICMKTYDLPEVRKDLTIDIVLDVLRKRSCSPEEEKHVIWKVIAKDKKSAIYENRVLVPFKGCNPQHQIEKVVLTERGFSAVTFVKNQPMTDKEKNEAIKRLKEDVSVIPFAEAVKADGLSFADKRQSLVVLGDSFKGWKHSHTYYKNYGLVFAQYIPPWELEDYVLEGLDVISDSNPMKSPIEDLFESEKKYVFGLDKQTVACEVLEKTPMEMVFSFSHPIPEAQVHAIGRLLITDQGYYCFIYKQGFVKPLKEEELAKWRSKTTAKLKDIQIMGT